MKTMHFPYIALSLAIMLLLVVFKGSQFDNNGTTFLPLLTLLIMSEFAFFVTAIGSYIGIKQLLTTGFQAVYAMATLLCLILSVRFLLLGFSLWPL
ncbi:MAG: hypothetical protein RQ783_03180 [Gammaproteobacteria bacterium]|nr:hypothetical protein [Gammaproteobacteria bacterium]